MNTNKNHNAKRIAIFPGTFDPITNGHLDIIRRGAKLFDHLIVAIGHNPEKRTALSLAERMNIIAEITAEWPNVTIDSFKGLTIQFAHNVNATAILRGLRDSNDLQFESQLALTNRAVGDIETVFILTDPQMAFTSSSLVRQIAAMGGDASPLVPPPVIPHLKKYQNSAK